MAHEIYMKLGSLVGECNEVRHKLWVVLDSFSCSITAAAGDLQRNSGACEHAPMDISKHIDRASPKLAIAACKRSKFSKATIDICQQTTTGIASSLVLQTVLSNVTCLSYNLSGENNSTESISLQYETIEWRYGIVDAYTLAAKGKVIAKWDTLKNTGG